MFSVCFVRANTITLILFSKILCWISLSSYLSHTTFIIESFIVILLIWKRQIWVLVKYKSNNLL